MADDLRRSPGKRPLSAFLIFCCEKRKEIHQEKQMTLSDSTRLLSQRWKTMTVEEKQPFVDKSSRDKERYQKEQKETKGTLKRKRNARPPKKSKRSRVDEDIAKRGRPRVGVVDHNDVERPSSLPNAYVPDIGVPIFTDEFLQYNKKVNSELMKCRQVNKHLIDQKQRLEDTIQAIDLDIERVRKLVEDQALGNDKLELELQIIRKFVSDILSPNDGPVLFTSEELLDRALSGDHSSKHDMGQINTLIDELCKHYSTD